jgi:hypothetical protein
MKRKPLSQPKAMIIVAVVAGVFSLLAAAIAAKGVWGPDLPASIPTLTPKPTVVGTPLMGEDISVGGVVGETISANNITVVVDEVTAYSENALTTGYVLVVVKARISNGSCYYIISPFIKLIDDFSNEYVDWGAALAGNFQLPALSSVPNGKSAAGILVYQVPEPALANKLRLSINLSDGICSEPPTRLVVFFNDVIIPATPTP